MIDVRRLVRREGDLLRRRKHKNKEDERKVKGVRKNPVSTIRTIRKAIVS